jgi:hypothetical protein
MHLSCLLGRVDIFGVGFTYLTGAQADVVNEVGVSLSIGVSTKLTGHEANVVNFIDAGH